MLLPCRALQVYLLAASALLRLAESMQTYLPLQQPGQASVIVDDTSRTLYIVDLGKSGNGNTRWSTASRFEIGLRAKTSRRW